MIKIHPETLLQILGTHNLLIPGLTSGFPSDDFAEKVRTINLKLGHRFAGFVDKDTLRLTLDQI